MQQLNMTFSFTVIGALTITNVIPPQATQNKPYGPFNFTAIGGNPPYTWSATGLPAGMNLSSDGILSGTPTVAGVFSVSVTVQDVDK